MLIFLISIFSSRDFAHSGRKAPYSIFTKANVLNGQSVLFCSLQRCRLMSTLHVFLYTQTFSKSDHLCVKSVRSTSLMAVSVPPTLLGSDEVKTLTVPVNGHLTLECLADSDPAPEIEWYKDEVKVQVQRITQPGQTNPSPLTDTRIFFMLRQLGGRVQQLAGGQYLEIQEVRPEDSGLYSCVVTNMAGSSSLFFTVEILCKSF